MALNYQRDALSALFAPLEPSKHKFWDKEAGSTGSRRIPTSPQPQPRICKHFLVKFCPNSLFTNTKSDLGNCDLIHDERLREEFQNSPDKEKYGYEQDFFDYLSQLVHDLERKIRRGKERKDKEVDETLLNPRKDEREEKIIILEQKIKETLAKVEEAGEEGRVDEAQSLTEQVEKMQKELQHLKETDGVNPIFRQENKMEVCHVCGAFLVMNDTSNRLDAHLQGKQHTGYQKIQETYEAMKKERGDRGSSRSGRYGEGGGPSRDQYFDRDGRGRRDLRDYRDQPYNRDSRGGRRDSSRDRDRRRDYDRDRDRDRDYRRRDRERERDRRDRDDRRY
ncbi:Luc7-like protein 3 [Actinomortierella ambigua]|uniref:Luc7-like protein 3 n=1 Tax=Actinomortierella ambigua TaxID=1343610 RepID=A0A9P6QH85_9FUNG|nr:Luc7-like protein 3 [Actinomortierella ambigua]